MRPTQKLLQSKFLNRPWNFFKIRCKVQTRKNRVKKAPKLDFFVKI